MSDSNQPKKAFRFKLLIYPRFQLTLIAVNSAIMIAATSAVWFQVSRSFANLRKLGVDAGLRESHPFFEFLNFQSESMSVQLLAAFGFGFVMSSIATLFISHRLAGPILRLRGYFSTIASGKRPVQALSFRKNDFFDELPPIVNAAVESLQKDSSAKKHDDRAA